MFGYSQDGCKETMPRRDFDGQGWGVDPTLKSSGSLRLTKENCVMWLSEHSYVGSDNKTKTLACTSCVSPTPGKPINCQRCKYADARRKCSLSCGCRGSCNARRFREPGASPDQPAARPSQPAAPPTPQASATASPAPLASPSAPPMHNTVAGALRAMMASRATAAAAAQAEAAAAAQAEAEDAPQAEAAGPGAAQAEATAAAQAEAAAAAVAEASAAAQAEAAAAMLAAPVQVEDDTDRIPDWMSDASGTSDVGSDGGRDGCNDGEESDSDSNDGWDMSLEAGMDDEEWALGDD